MHPYSFQFILAPCWDRSGKTAYIRDRHIEIEIETDTDRHGVYEEEKKNQWII